MLGCGWRRGAAEVGQSWLTAPVMDQIFRLVVSGLQEAEHTVTINKLEEGRQSQLPENLPYHIFDTFVLCETSYRSLVPLIMCWIKEL